MKLQKFSFGVGDRFVYCSDFFTIDVGDAIGGRAPDDEIAAFVELHVGYEVAANMGKHYHGALRRFETGIARNVTENPWQRHITPLFVA